MPDKAYFLDTNVLVYGYTSQSDAKSDIANALITSGEAMVSAQVLNEFCNTIRRKFADMYPNIDTALDELVSVLPVAPLTLATTRSAVGLSQRYGWSYYDALIVAVALEAGCSVVLSEDMQHGMFVDSRLRIENPFLQS